MGDFISRISELEAENAALRAEVEDLKQELHDILVALRTAMEQDT